MHRRVGNNSSPSSLLAAQFDAMLKSENETTVELAKKQQRKTPIQNAVLQLNQFIDLERLDLFQFVCEYTHDLWRYFDNILTAAVEKRKFDVICVHMTSLVDVEWSYRCTCFKKDEEDVERALFIERKWKLIFETLNRLQINGDYLILLQRMLETLNPPLSVLKSIYSHLPFRSPLQEILESFIVLHNE